MLYVTFQREWLLVSELLLWKEIFHNLANVYYYAYCIFTAYIQKMSFQKILLNKFYLIAFLKLCYSSKTSHYTSEMCYIDN